MKYTLCEAYRWDSFKLFFGVVQSNLQNSFCKIFLFSKGFYLTLDSFKRYFDVVQSNLQNSFGKFFPFLQKVFI